jgi:hypothetical protein
MMVIDNLKALMKAEEIDCIGIDSLAGNQQEALYQWGIKMFGLGQYIVSDIEDIKYDGRLIVLDDGTRWEVDSGDTGIAELWSAFDKVAVIDDEMFKLSDAEKVSVEEEC